ncbi:MAG: sugar phosphate isomerase/epimerase family protein [Fimbriiglobus sp.]
MKYAICNETFGDWDHARVCATVAECGYTGLEVAPFTLAPLITDVSAAKRAELRQQAEAAGVQIIGLHWLLAKTEGFELTSPDRAVRERTGDYLADLAYAAADLGGNILVLGSPKQRNIPQGYTHAQADEFALDTLRHCLRALEKTQVVLCLEPLTKAETNFLNSAAEGVGMIRRLGHPYVKLHLDVKAMSGECAPIPDIIRANADQMHHFHANDPNLRGPGFGDQDFRPIMAALRDARYNGWVSVEVFDYTPDPVTIARESLAYMKACAKG